MQQSSFPRGESMKNQCGERESLLLFLSALIVGRRVVRLQGLERWEGGEVGKGGW